jgi:hypothetical protein
LGIGGSVVDRGEHDPRQDDQAGQPDDLEGRAPIADQPPEHGRPHEEHEVGTGEDAESVEQAGRDRPLPQSRQDGAQQDRHGHLRLHAGHAVVDVIEAERQVPVEEHPRPAPQAEVVGDPARGKDRDDERPERGQPQREKPIHLRQEAEELAGQRHEDRDR